MSLPMCNYLSNMPLENPIRDTKANTCSVIVPHLPNEVLTAILSHLPLSRDLASAALVSRKFDALVQGFLYRSLQLNVRASEEEIQSYYSSGGKPHTFERFSRLIDRLSSNAGLGYVYQQVFDSSHCQRGKATNLKS